MGIAVAAAGASYWAENCNLKQNEKRLVKQEKVLHGWQIFWQRWRLYFVTRRSMKKTMTAAAVLLAITSSDEEEEDDGRSRFVINIWPVSESRNLA